MSVRHFQSDYFIQMWNNTYLSKSILQCKIYCYTHIRSTNGFSFITDNVSWGYHLISVHWNMDMDIGRSYLIFLCYQHLSAPTSTVLLVVHRKDVYNLPSAQWSLVLEGSEFTQLYGIYSDYHNERRVCPYNMNSTAIENIVRFIRSYKEYRISICQ